MSEQTDTLLTADYADTAEARETTRIADEPPAAQGTIRLIGRVGFHAAPCAEPCAGTVLQECTSFHVYPAMMA